MVWAGLLPAKISALGVDFSPTDQKKLLRVVAAIVVYFCVAFVIYAASDFLAWRHALTTAVREAVLKREEDELKEPVSDWNKKVTAHVNRVLDSQFKQDLLLTKLGMPPVSMVRALFEFAAPIFIGGFSVYLLLK